MNSTNSNGRWEFDQDGNVHYVEPEGGKDEAGTHTYNYHYNYNNNDSESKSSASQSKRKKKSDDGWHWILIVLGFAIWWPVGLVLLFMELGGKWPGNKKVEQEFRRAANAAQSAAKSAARQFEQAQANKQKKGQNTQTGQSAAWQETMQATRAAQEKKQSQKAKKAKKKAKKENENGAAYGLGSIKMFRMIGGILTGVFGFAFVMELIDELTYFIGWDYLLSETVPLLAFMLAGVTLLGVGASRKRKLRLFQKYLTMIGTKQVVPLAALAAAMGKSEKKVEKDLEEMLERGVLDQGYVDAARRALVLGSPLEDMLEPEIETEPEQEPSDNASATLRRIRSVNDAIANREISDKIDRIEELTAKIFRLLEERPEKAGELRSFMNYYLPQTLKILESYSKLEAQGIEGENIAEAKQKIEAMMDKLVDGYETQLDKLFADDVLDISADLKVMESMLEKDGLTVDSELHF